MAAGGAQRGCAVDLGGAAPPRSSALSIAPPTWPVSRGGLHSTTTVEGFVLSSTRTPAPDRMRSCHVSFTAVTLASVSFLPPPQHQSSKAASPSCLHPALPHDFTSASDSTLNFQPEPPGRGPTASPAVLTPAPPGTPFSRLPIL